MKVKFIKFNENARIPEKAHPTDLCYDVWCVSEEEIAPNLWQYKLGFGLQIERHDEKFDGEVIIDTKHSPLIFSIDFRPRSSIYKTGMTLCNCEATIDEGYTGEIKLNFYHIVTSLPRYKAGDKIAQCKIGFTFPINFVEVKELDKTDRNDNGLGSSGLK